MPPERNSLFPSFAGVALADILANSVAIVMIMIAVTLIVRYHEEEEKLDQTEDVAVLLSRELASSFVMNALPTSPPAQLHDYLASPLDQSPHHSLMPIVELHPQAVRNHYTGETFARDEMLRHDSAFDAYLDTLSVEQKMAVRIDVYSTRQFYVAMSVLKHHGIEPRHWHFLDSGAMGSGEGGMAGPSLRFALRRERPEPGLGGDGDGRRPDGSGRSGVPEDVAAALSGSVDMHYPGDAVAGLGRGSSTLSEFNLPSSSTRAGTGDGPQGGGVPADAMRFRTAAPPDNNLPIGQGEMPDMRDVLRGLFAFMAVAQEAADQNLPSPLPDYDFRRDVLAAAKRLPPADRAEQQRLDSLVFLLENPRPPQEDLTLRPRIADDVRGQAIALYPNEPMATALWLRDAAQPPPDDALRTAWLTTRIGLHAEVVAGLRVPLARGSLLLAPEADPDPAPRWRAATLVNPERNDFVTGFLYAAVDDTGRLVLAADENAIDMGGLRLESVYPPLPLRGELQRLLFYGALALLFGAALIGWMRRLPSRQARAAAGTALATAPAS